MSFTFTPGPSALPLDVACQRAQVRFHFGLQAIRRGLVFAYADERGYWFVSTAAVPVLQQLGQQPAQDLEPAGASR
jgi:hypothetical protein